MGLSWFAVDFRNKIIYFAIQSRGRMNDLNRALGDIHSIRRQVAHSTEFRGYGPATLACTGALALTAATAQSMWVPDVAHHLVPYLAIWIVTAILSAAMIATEMLARTQRIHSGLADEMIRMAVEQFLPSAGVGGLVTFVLVQFVPAATWMIPGLWQVIFSLGVFASCRFLPRPVAIVGAWYLLTGLSLLSLGDARALSPWAMGIPYAAGQLMLAGILLLSSKKDNDENEA
jgi:hypothetical protein